MRMKEVDCCYNCKYFCKTFYLGDVWVCGRKATVPLNDSFFYLKRVEPNNKCKKWEHKRRGL